MGHWPGRPPFVTETGMRPDYFGNDCDMQLPIFSVIGRGPTGDTLSVEENPDNDESQGIFKLDYVNERTNKVVYTTPNLHFGVMSITQSPSDPKPGQLSTLLVSVKRDGKVVSYGLTIPPGARGALTWLAAGEPMTHTASGLYTFGDNQLSVQFQKPDKTYVPDYNDIVVFTEIKAHTTTIHYGVIVTVNSDNVVVYSKQHFDIDLPWIGENGNWWVGDEDTGYPARGPKGDKGDQGEKGDKGDPGTGLEIDGTVESPDDLDSIVDPWVGMTIICQGQVFIWDGEKWVDNGLLQGPQGNDGESAYDAAVAGGYTGTKEQFYAILNDITKGDYGITSFTATDIDELWGSTLGTTAIYVTGDDIVAMTNEEVEALFTSASQLG